MSLCSPQGETLVCVCLHQQWTASLPSPVFESKRTARKKQETPVSSGCRNYWMSSSVGDIAWKSELWLHVYSRSVLNESASSQGPVSGRLSWIWANPHGDPAGEVTPWLKLYPSGHKSLVVFCIPLSFDLFDVGLFNRRTHLTTASPQSIRHSIDLQWWTYFQRVNKPPRFSFCLWGYLDSSCSGTTNMNPQINDIHLCVGAKCIDAAAIFHAGSDEYNKNAS